MTYWLSVVKFVPDPAKGEFINVGAIAGSDDTEEWAVRSVGSWARAKRLDDRNTIGAVANFISGLEVQIELSQEGKIGLSEGLTLDKLRSLSDEMNNIVQISQPVPVALSSAADVLDLAFQELIIDPPSRRLQYARKDRAVSATRSAYREMGVPTYREVRVQTGSADTAFDFAVANGSTVQLVRCWSFQLPDQNSLAEEIKAWAWGVRAIRMMSDAQTFVAESSVPFPVNGAEVDVEAVYVPPAEQQKDTKAFKVALEAFRDSAINVHARPMDDAKSVAQRAETLLWGHH